MVPVPQPLERLYREAAEIDGTAAGVIEMHRVARAEPAEALALHRRAPARIVVDVDRDRGLVVARARPRREADSATAGLIPAIEQVLLRQRAEAGVDRQRHAARLLRSDERVGRRSLEVGEDRSTQDQA